MPHTLPDLRRALLGMDVIEYLPIDNASSDLTAEVAWQVSVHHFYLTVKGLAGTFLAGNDACLMHGIAVSINTDANNQYNAEGI